jgi:hypothetical protein
VTFSLHAVLLYGFDLRHWKAVLGCWRKALLAKHFWQSTFYKALIVKRLLQSACGNGDGLNPGAVHRVKTSCQGGRWKMLQNAVKLKADQSHSKTKN